MSVSYRAHAMGVVSLAALALTAAPAAAQEVRGPESPQPTSASPSPASSIPDQPSSQPTGAESGSTGLADIIVTARKVAENLQNVPIAVTAVSGEGLQQLNAVRLNDVARIAPGLTIRPASSNASGVNIQIRGQFQNDVLATLDPSVGTYVDGFYWARAYGLSADFLDVQSAQVLRGPQGTLFGRNTTGGALLIQTNDPIADRFTALLSGGYGRFDERTATGVVNIPIIEDRIAIRLAGNFLKRDGYTDDIPFTFNGVTTPFAKLAPIPFAGSYVNKAYAGSAGRKLADRDTNTIRAKLLLKPTENFSLLFSAEQFKFDSFAQNWRLAAVDPNSAANIEAGLELGATAATAAALGRQFFAAYIPYAQNGDHVSLNEDPRSVAKTQTFTGTATLDTFFGAIKFIGGYRRVKSFAPIDLDGSPIFIFDTLGRQDLKQYSGELQFTGKALDDTLDFAAGVFYFKEYGFDRSNSIALPLVSTLNPTARLSNNVFFGVIDTRSQGLYGQATYHFTDSLSFTGGLRYSVEDKGITSFNRVTLASTNATVACSITGADITSTNPENCRIQRKDDFSGVSYTAGINYNLNADTLVYAKTSKGFRSGGQNLRASGTANAAFVPFGPETTYEHELGLKTELFDRRLRINLAGFYNTVDGIQRSTLVTFINPITGAPGTATIVSNAGKTRNYGGEAEVTAALFEGFTLTATAAYIKPKYKRFIGITAAGLPIDRSNERFEQVPRYTAAITGNYSHEIGFGKLDLNANYAYQAKTPLGVFNYYTDAAGVTRDVSGGLPITLATAQAIYKAQTQKAGGQLNLRAAVTVLDGMLELAAWGRNVTNFRPNISSLFFTPATSVLATQKRDPAMYGGTVTVRFR